MNERKPTNCQQEPPYRYHRTVIFALSAPDMTLHRPTKRCKIQEPHAIKKCGEWKKP